MTRRVALVACAALTVALLGCSSGPARRATTTTAVPGCHTHSSIVHLLLSDAQPVPVVRVAPGECLAVSVPRPPFRGHASESPTLTPAGLLVRVSDSTLPDGARIDYFAVVASGTVRITSTVSVRTTVAVPEWVGIVHVV
jgi:hypothetical protein